MLQNRELQIMDKKIGKLFLIVVLFSTTALGAREPKITIDIINKNRINL